VTHTVGMTGEVTLQGRVLEDVPLVVELRNGGPDVNYLIRS